CWNFKPHLVQAMSDFRVFLRMQAQECLCPLNNLRLLPADDGLKLCPHDQLAEPAECFHCLVKRGEASGALHQVERRLSAVGTPEYDQLLRKSLRQAEAVLVLNPRVADSFRPWCRRVEVVTWGMDPTRFPPPEDTSRTDGTVRLLFAGLSREPIKGFEVVRAACRILWQRRQDFQLIATGESSGQTDPFVRMIGWQSQSELPAWYRQADICVVPTIAPDGLSRTSVEAMASGRPVIASRIGGLPFTVDHGRTGLLCRPGDPQGWSEAIEQLLDDADLRRRMGKAGRTEFERRFRWEDVIERSYRPLLAGHADYRLTSGDDRELPDRLTFSG
ncbi:MAG: glycosyltransferase family 4 protein, partial [Planctomycetaceae bacterium]|nr:glycosyltransferase family 4 protein [Planctomycetaceae bacterium]